MKTTYFGVPIIEENDWNYVLEEDLKKLPFYEFWEESAKGSACPIINNKVAINIIDWENFCKLFIKTGKHRYQKELYETK